MKKFISGTLALILLTMIIAGCSAPPPTPASTATKLASTTTALASPAISSTTDPCTLPRLETEVQEVHKHMREFDDASVLASNMPREQLSGSIADLQRIRREAEDETVPPCLTQLKTYQVQHMNSVISTLIAFMGGTDQQTLDQGIALARQQHDQYTLELAKVLGLTIVAVTPPSGPSETPTPTP